LQKCEQKWNIFSRNLSTSNHEIKKCLLFRCRHAVAIMQTLNWTNHIVRYSWQSAIILRSVMMTTTELYLIYLEIVLQYLVSQKCVTKNMADFFQIYVILTSQTT
jgi:hypothetical protein